MFQSMAWGSLAERANFSIENVEAEIGGGDQIVLVNGMGEASGES